MSHNKQNKDDILHRPDEISQLPAEIPRLPATWYDQLIDPPNPPPRDLDKPIIIPINDEADKKSFPSGEDLGEAPEAFEAFEATSK